MEKFSQFRDKGSGIAPFIPITSPSSPISTLIRVLIFSFRLPIFFTLVATTVFIQCFPIPTFLRKLMLWALMGIAGIWWVDLQIDGVRRGTLSEQPSNRIPHARSVIAANFTSPIDVMYLAGIFDPVFTVSYPNTRQVRTVSLLGAIMHALDGVHSEPPEAGKLTDIEALLKRYPNRVIVVFPEGSTTNGRGILPFSPSLLACPAGTHIFPVSLRYTPPDVTTPLPGQRLKFLWNLLSHSTICIRVRIADPVTTPDPLATNGQSSALHRRGPLSGEGGALTTEEQRFLDKIAEALARLGRSSRVGLTLSDKAAFVQAWNRKKGRTAS